MAHGLGGERGETTAVWRALSGRLGAGLLAALLAACGGGSGSSDPPPTPPPTAQGFAVLPGRVSLAVQGEGVLRALADGRAVTWTSSNPAVASVDSAGRIVALTKGKAVIRATAGTDTAAADLTVYSTTGANPDPSPDTLIAQALAAKRIDAEQALTYRVYALFGDERLPVEFDGPPSGEPDHGLLRQLATTVHELSPATQDLLRPFLLPPMYAESWYARRAGLAPDGGRRAPTAAVRAALNVECEASRLPDFFPRVSTRHFNIHYMKSLDPAQDAVSAQVVAMIAGFIEADYAVQTGLLGRAAIADDREPCNGGDARVDIYYGAFALFGTGAWTRTYALPRGSRGVNACARRPSVVMLNKNSLEFMAIERSLTQGRAMARSIVAHELLHVLQFAMPRQASCRDTEWFDEATAQWVMDHVVPTIARNDPGEHGMEPGVTRVAPAYQKSGPMLADYLFAGHMVPIEEPGASVKRNGYADYLFFQYVARALAPERIRDMYNAMAGGAGSVEAMAAGVDLKAAWPGFARTLWIGEEVFDFWRQEDEYRYGLEAVYAGKPTVGIPQAVKDSLKTIEVDQQGRPRATFELLKNARHFEGTLIPPRSIFYEHLKFSDPTVHSVYLSNPIGSLPEREFIKLQAVKKIAGQWQAPEDWTAEPYKQFCLDQKDERIEELLLIVSNSEARRGTEKPFLIPEFFPMQLGTSNVGCWGWIGSASRTTTSGAPYNIDAVARITDAYFRVRSVLPGRVSFGTVAGLVSGRRSSTSLDGNCTFTSVAASKQLCIGLGCLGAPPTADGTLDIDLDLDQGFGGLVGAPPPDRELNDLGGSTLLATTDTAVCPTGTTSGTGNVSWDWLSTTNPGRFTVSADGRMVEGRTRVTDANGATIITTWKFTAVRE